MRVVKSFSNIPLGAAREGHLVKFPRNFTKWPESSGAQGNFIKRPSSGGTFSIANSPLFMLLPYNIMIAGIPVVLALKTN